MPTDPYTLCWDQDATLLVADVSWDALQAARRGLGLAVEVAAPPVLRPGGTTVLAGDLDGRAYVYHRTAFDIVEPDLVAALAAHTGGLVLGYGFQDNLGLVAVTAARGAALLRYVWGTTAPYWHEEGTPLPGETPDAPVYASAGLRRVLAALGFFPEGAAGWLARGTRWDAWLDAPSPDARPEAHARLHFGPLRQRVAALEEALDDEFGP